ncbi:T9SS type A sorting domain-containing protein [Bacteroidales bacterium OttesenSCG-928-K03]|nr:T9SS type A sorting domain-containing protein [Bacteroidales bacterium OttesenSCG-928-L14]MDL2240658.1 T9SS type A sorting domain-containing protein [Bacteroidales bacterium OttesenSCG-928-K22]MDL2242834.1 T9SS type A sorting domain-containing protein [Bacteroidales bacterium OttesenSCG-928-K03]
MKKIITFCLVGLMAFTAFGQPQKQLKKLDHPQVSAAIGETTKIEPINMPLKSKVSTKAMTLASQEFTVGVTTYDLQSNAALQNRVHRFSDGRIAATWTGGKQSPATYPDRGSFYNLFNGTTWETSPNDVSRIEEIRAGWPSYAVLGNGEIIASHGGDPSRTQIRTRAQVGTGSWSNPIDVTAESTWPRICVNNGTIHILSAYSFTDVGGVARATIKYSRSKDGGQTWSPKDETFELLGTDHYFYAYSADDYVWAEPKNGMIAFSVASGHGDLLIFKSNDDGDNWEKVTVWQHPVPFFDGNTHGPQLTDTIFCPNGAQSLAIDDNGICHLSFNTYRLFWNEEKESMNYLVYYSHAMYWNETMYPFYNANQYRALDPEWNVEYFEDGSLLIPYGFDFTGDGRWYSPDGAVAYRNGGLIHGTSIAMAGPNRLIIAVEVQDKTALYDDLWMYSRIFLCSYKYNETFDEWTFDTEWKHDPSMASYDLYEEEQVLMDNHGWFRMINPTLHMFDNCMYTQILVQESNDDKGNFYVFYQADEMPGETSNASSYNPQAYQPSSTAPVQYTYTDNYQIMYVEAVDFSGANIPEIPMIGIEDIKPVKEELTIYPNPASNMINVVVNNPVNCVIYNMTGQVVSNQQLSEGKNSVNISNLKPGVYFVSAGNSNAKLVVK